VWADVELALAVIGGWTLSLAVGLGVLVFAERKRIFRRRP
jgi:hypothetical protein